MKLAEGDGSVKISPNNEKTDDRKPSSALTVEPVIFLYFFSSLLNILTNQNLNLEKACRVDLHFNSSVCDAMINRDIEGYSKSQEVEVQKLVSEMGAVRSIFIGLFPLILMLFVGSWSDRHLKRKPVILLPICCDIVACFLLFLCSYFFMELPVIYSTLSEAIPFAIGGAWCCFVVGIYSYVSDNCSEKERTTRIGSVVIIHGISMTSGTAAAGVLIEPLGYKWIYILSCSLMAIAVIYGYIRIKNPREKKDYQKNTKKNFMTDFFDIRHIKNTMAVCFKRGPSRRKMKICFLMFLTMILFGISSGEHILGYLYTRIKFGWDEKIFSVYSTFLFLVHIIGSAIALMIFSRYFGMSDALLGIISVSFQITASLIFAFANSGRMFCIGGLLQLFHGSASIALRSMMSKIVPSDELGQSNSLFGLCEAIVPTLFVPVYSALYNSTMKSFLGAHYLLSAGIYLIPLALFYCLYYIGKTEEGNAKETPPSENMDYRKNEEF